MNEQLWQRVDAWFDKLLLGDDALGADFIAASEHAELPAIHVSPLQGRLLELLVRIAGARRVLELGTLGGYSTLWLARALPQDGHIVTLELDPRHADVARANFARAALEPAIDLRVGPALDALRILRAEKSPPFDFIFLDADKSGYPAYLPPLLELSRPGTVIVADNVVRGGAVADTQIEDPLVRGAREFTRLVAAHPRLRSTAIQTVGAKGHDGFALIRVEP